MSQGSLADIWEGIARRFPAHPALLLADGTAVCWAEFNRRANALAAALAARGLTRGDRLAVLMRNQPEYLVSCFAAFKIGLAPVNVNYRYTAGELANLFTLAAVDAVVVAAEFAGRVEPLPGVIQAKMWLGVPDDSGTRLPDWLESWPDVLAGPAGAEPPEAATAARSGDDQILLFTGGTTGMPKGVVWRHRALIELTLEARADMFDGRTLTIDELIATANPGDRVLPAAPFMHGTGLLTSIGLGLLNGGAVICVPQRSFDAGVLLDAAATCGATVIVIAGNAFAIPVIDALRERPRWDLSALRVVMSSGVAFGRRHKERLLELLPGVTIVETLGASEGTGVGTAVAVPGSIPPTGRFRPGRHVRLITQEGSPVPVGEPGLVAVSGPLPDGYFRDDLATAKVYRRIDGERYSVPGDWARAHPDGTIELLGRGASSVNTAGEKVYPGEVEAALLTSPAVRQVAVVGVPDERLGEAVCAVIVTTPDHEPSDADLLGLVRSSLAAYKAPRHVVRVADLPRTTTGKIDYLAVRQQALTALGI